MVAHNRGPGREQWSRRPANIAFTRLLVGAMTFLPGSCVSHGTALPLPSANPVVVPCEHINLSVRLLDFQGDLHLHGTVRSQEFRSGFGQVDVEVRDADGGVWAQDRVNYRLHHRPRIGPGPAFISLTLQGLPPLGSTVEFRHHHESRNR